MEGGMATTLICNPHIWQRCLSKNANMLSNFMPPDIRWQNVLNPKKIHRQIWSTETHVDKGKWLELDPGAQCNIAYRTWYFDCRLNVTIYMYQLVVWRWLWSDPLLSICIRWWFGGGCDLIPLLSICIRWWFGGGCDLTPYYLYVSVGGLEVVVIWSPYYLYVSGGGLEVVVIWPPTI